MPPTMQNPAAAGQPQAGMFGNAFETANFTASASPGQEPWPTTKLEWALWNARHLGRVFPIRPGDTKPAIKDNLRLATRDEEQIRVWWTDGMTGESNDRNVGLVADGGEAGWVVVDLDPKNNPKVIQDLELMLEMWEADQPTFTVETANRGRHLYYRTPEPIGTGAHTNKFMEGIDTRGAGTGYVVAPGSTRRIQVGRTKEESELRTYKIVSNAPIGPMPEKLAKALRGTPRSLEPSVGTAAPLVELDQPHNIERAAEYVKSAKAPAAGTRNERTNRVAFRAGDFGISEQQCVDIMLEHWLPKCPGGWTADDMLPPIRSAFQRRRTRLGSGAPEVQFPPLPDADLASAATSGPAAPVASNNVPKPHGLFFVKFGEVKPVLNRRYLLKPILMSGGSMLLYAEPGQGKTFLVIDMSFHIATGMDWRGHKVQRGLVVYVAAEGGELINNRIVALQKRYPGVDALFALVPCPIDLLRPNGDVQALINLVATAEAAFGEKAVLVVIDTASRALAGGNENSPDDMGAFVRHLDKIRAATKAATLTIHHAGKDTSKGARGHSLLRAAVDTEIEVADCLVTVTKQRDGKAAAPFRFELVTTILGEDDEGEFVDSCTVEYPEPGAPPSPESLAAIEDGLSDDEANLLEVVRGFEAAGASLDVITSVAINAGWTTAIGKSAKDLVRRTLRRLENGGLIACSGARVKARWSAVPSATPERTEVIQ